MNTQEKKQLTQQAITNFAIANFFLNEAEKKGFDYARKLLAYERARANLKLAEIESHEQQEKVEKAKAELEHCTVEYHLILQAEK